MELKIIDGDFSVCRVKDLSKVDFGGDYYFIGRTDEEFSLVCETKDVPDNAEKREDNWKAFRFEGVLDFSLTGILSAATAVLAEEKIGIFAVSTYNTDYILVKSDKLEAAVSALKKAGYKFKAY